MRRITGFSVSPIVLVLLTGFIGLSSFCILHAQTEEKMIVISEKVGEVIDAEERAYFALFEAYKGFKSAVFLELPDSGYVAEITYEENGEEKKSRLPLNKQSIKSLKNYFKNYKEIKPRLLDFEIKKQKVVRTPFNLGRVAGEILGGIGTGIIVGFGGIFIGSVFRPPENDDLGGGVLGFVIAYPIGSAIGVNIVGNKGNETGSFGATLGGGILGAVVGIGTFFADIPQISLLCPPIGSAIGFNMTRRYRTPPVETGFIDYRDSRLNLAVPSVYYTQENTFEGKTMVQNVTLVKVSF